ncbi:DNA polymerase III subunit gamma/tau [Anaerosphaera multitolerans]|uniref:DNA-directed DNA polymerase n=1 Tax=Anaerosphaera multitolerans TaxID=2487351 RepID=A0A437S4B4_9FIRM|nr:DNA polymerase III subunit gamma/tau [Anaerosphaera multitolerans]RVU53844.1 DNA polymerase III subunit gamma/tau [Anaerosphaera multitolerans]
MYQALYRKYRSRTFNELVGQDHIVTALKNQIKNEELSHAYLFSGTRGTGKTSAAKIFARAVNCLNPHEGEPCNECESCISILEDRVMDVVEMDAASNNGVDDIRELKEKVVYPPSTSKYKVYIIDEVHMLSKGAFNALLKILEEPPRHLIFILATTEPEKIPQTILSRTQRFNFKRISTQVIIENLRRITELENKSCDDEVFTLIANNSDGAMRDALSLLDQCLSFTDEHISYELATEVLGITNEEVVFKLVDALVDRDINRALTSLDNIYMSGKDITILISDLIVHFRNIMVVKTVKDFNELLYTTRIEEYSAISAKIDLDDILEILKILNKTLADIKYVQDKKTIFEMSVIKIINSKSDNLEKRIEILESIIDSLKNDGSLLSSDIKSVNIEAGSINKEKAVNIDKSFENKKSKVESKTPKEEKTVEMTKSSGTLNLNKILESWDSILNGFKQQKRVNIAVLLSMARVSDFKNNTLFIEYDEKNFFNYKAISTEDNVKFITDFLNNYFKENMEIKFQIANFKEKNEAIERVENIFGNENIERI